MKVLLQPWFRYSPLLLLALFSGRADASYLFDELNKPTFLKSWDTMVGQEKDLDPWILRYGKTRNGPSAPERKVKLGGKPYRMEFVCKTNDCGNNQLFVLFQNDGTQVWGLLLKGGNSERFLGNPDKEKQDALRHAAKN